MEEKVMPDTSIVPDKELVERIENVISKIKCSDADAQRIRQAFTMANEAHAGQKRRSGEPYIIHPVAVAEILGDFGMDPDTIAAGILHDCIEDTKTDYSRIKSRFGVQVADMVDGVTKLTNLHAETAEEEEVENLRKMFIAMARDIRVIIIKLVDRLHNLRTLMYQTPEKQKIKALESMQVYAPIAHRLGMNNIKNEMEDLSLKYLDPVGYKEIVEYLEKNNAERQSVLDLIIVRLRKRLEAMGVKAHVEGRLKHIYGIYRKVYMQGRNIGEIYDIYAVRVIVDSIAQCYNILGMVHELYKPIPGRFKDYIYTPKPNMYQSLHTTVIGREGQPFEVQIRTWDMHNTAEYGIAAHWKYKDGITATGDEGKFAWVRRLLESQQESDPEDFIKNIRVEMFADEVFVFTPKGDVINMPAGAGPIDFAYAIHSAIGNRMVGAKVNGRMVPFDYMLKNGDIVEVLTSNTAHGPSRDWLGLVKTGEARTKIKQWFKKERREENVELGRAAFEAELKCNLLTRIFEQEDVREKIIKKYGFSSVEDMYAAIGYGGISTRKIINRFTEENIKAERANRAAQRSVRQTKPTSGVIVEGVDNCLIKFARCCTPIPGDKIIGFITKGYGVSVHRADCPNITALLKREDTQNRILKVRWAGEESERYQTALQIVGHNRIGFIADITALISERRIELTSMSAKELPNGDAHVEVVLNLCNAEQLGQTVLYIKRIEGVREVSRIIR